MSNLSPNLPPPQPPPLLRSTIASLLHCQPLQKLYLLYLSVLALVVVIWWPKSELVTMLDRDRKPATLLALLICLGALLAYHSLRSGAGEIPSIAPSATKQWRADTATGAFKVVLDFVLGQLLQIASLLTLCAPLLVMAAVVAGEDWRVVLWGLLACTAQAVFYGLCGALVNMLYAPREFIAFAVSRTSLLVGYAATPFFYPKASHFLMCLASMHQNDRSRDTGFYAQSSFFVLYSALSALLVGALCWRIKRARQTAT